MNTKELFEEFTIKIYEAPLNEYRENGNIRDLSNPISVVMLVIDFDTEVTMNGICDYIGNNTGRFSIEIVAALKEIGCQSYAEKLQNIQNIATTAGMTYQTIQQERSGATQYSVTSFSELHGEKWSTASEEMESIASEINSNEMRARAEMFVSDHVDAFRRALELK